MWLSNRCGMLFETLSVEVQQKDARGVWRTIWVNGITVHDGWKMPPDWRYTMYRAPYVPGKTGAQYSPFRMTGGV